MGGQEVFRACLPLDGQQDCKKVVGIPTAPDGLYLEMAQLLKPTFHQSKQVSEPRPTSNRRAVHTFHHGSCCRVTWKI